MKVGEYKGVPIICFCFSDSYMSNYYICNYRLLDFDLEFSSSLQHFEFLKAVYFDDELMAKKILNHVIPRRQKHYQIGFKERYDEDQWDSDSIKLMKQAVKDKFMYGEDCLKDKLLFDVTPDTVIVQASSEIKWGGGIPISHPNLFDLSLHSGRNLMGRILKATYFDLIGYPEQGERVLENELWNSIFS